MRLCLEVLFPRRPKGEFNIKEYLFNYNTGDTPMSAIRESLYQTLQLRVSYLHLAFVRRSCIASNCIKPHRELNTYCKRYGILSFSAE